MQKLYNRHATDKIHDITNDREIIQYIQEDWTYLISAGLVGKDLNINYHIHNYRITETTNRSSVQYDAILNLSEIKYNKDSEPYRELKGYDQNIEIALYIEADGYLYFAKTPPYITCDSRLKRN